MFPQNRHDGRTAEAGFSLIQLLVSIAVVSVGMTLYFKMSEDMKHAEKRLAASSLYQDIDDLLKAEIIHFLSQIRAQANCLNYSNVYANRTIASEANNVPIRFTTRLTSRQDFTPASSGLTLEQIDKAIAEMESNEKTAAAINRCARPVTPRNFQANNQNNFYFCLSFSRDPGASSSSFMASPRAFAEIALELTNAKTASPISCQNFFNAKTGVGAEVFINVYWLTRGPDFYYKSHSMNYFVEKP